MQKSEEKTPFYPSFGNRPQRLLGRDPLMKQLETGLKTPPGSRERVVIVTGQRGYGKTVLLLELAERARKQGFLVTTPTVVTPDMPEVILDKIQKEMSALAKTGKKKVTGANIGAFGFSAGIQTAPSGWESHSFSVRLDELCEEANRRGKGVLLLVDEAQGGSAEMKQLAIAYQEMVGAGRDVALVMAGLPAALSMVLNDKVLTFLNRAEKIELEPLRTGEIESYYHQAFAKSKIEISGGMQQYAAERASGSPYMMQLIGYYLTQFARPAGKVTKKILQKSLQYAEKDFQKDICLTVLQSLSNTDVRFLSTMAEADGVVQMADVTKKMNVSRAYAQQYRKRLLDAGIIESVRRGEVRFAVPYLKEYLRLHPAGD